MFPTTKPKTKKPVVRNPLEVDNHQQKKPRNVVDSIFGTRYSETSANKFEAPKAQSRRVEFTLFDDRTDREPRRVVQEISAIQNQIEQQLVVLKKQTNQFSGEVKAIEREVINSMPEKPGVYHVKFMEFLLTLLGQLSAKIGEANSWLTAMQSKKAKRGSAFMVRSKSKGTQYSMSQELSNARSIQ